MQVELSKSEVLERILHLRSFPGIGDAPISALNHLAENAQEITFKKGEVIFEEGKAGQTLYFVLDGMISLRHGKKTVHRVHGNEMLGALSVFAPNQPSPQALVEQDCFCLKIDGRTFYDVLEENFPLMLITLRGMILELITTRRLSGPDALFKEQLCALPQSKEPMGLFEKILLLNKSLVFASSQVDTITQLARNAHEYHFKPGVTLWEEKDSSTDFFILVKGQVEGRNERQSFTFGPGDAVGVLDAMAGVPRWYSARSKNQCVALHLTLESVWDVLEDNPEMGIHLIEAIAIQIIDLRRFFADHFGTRSIWA